MKKLLLSLGLLTVMAMPACAEKYATVNVDYAMSKFPAAQQAWQLRRQGRCRSAERLLQPHRGACRTGPAC